MASAHVATHDICNLTRVDPISLEILIRFVDEVVEKVMKESPGRELLPSSKHVTNDSEFSSPTYGQPETPTEVENVYF